MSTRTSVLAVGLLATVVSTAFAGEDFLMDAYGRRDPSNISGQHAPRDRNASTAVGQGSAPRSMGDTHSRSDMAMMADCYEMMKKAQAVTRPCAQPARDALGDLKAYSWRSEYVFDLRRGV